MVSANSESTCRAGHKPIFRIVTEQAIIVRSVVASSKHHWFELDCWWVTQKHHG